MLPVQWLAVHPRWPQRALPLAHILRVYRPTVCNRTTYVWENTTEQTWMRHTHGTEWPAVCTWRFSLALRYFLVPSTRIFTELSVLTLRTEMTLRNGQDSHDYRSQCHCCALLWNVRSLLIEGIEPLVLGSCKFELLKKVDWEYVRIRGITLRRGRNEWV